MSQILLQKLRWRSEKCRAVEKSESKTRRNMIESKKIFLNIKNGSAKQQLETSYKVESGKCINWHEFNKY